MRIGAHQLQGHLERALAPVYLLCGEEPLQLDEAAHAIREQAARRGYSERQCLEQTRDFDWGRLAAEAGALSLFADRRLIELRVTTDKIGREGADAVRAYCSRVSDDVLLLIIAPALDWKDLKAKWVEALDRVGVVVQVRPIQGAQLIPWLEQRLRSAGFVPTREAAALLAQRVEGNLPAAAQEIAKLALLREPGALDAQGLLSVVADSARFDLFDLSDAALAGDRARVDRVLRGLAAEGTAEPLVLWVLAREVRKLAALAFAQSRRRDLGPVFAAHQVWESRRGAVLAALKRFTLPRLWGLLEICAEADQAIKGRGARDPWPLLQQIAEGLASPPALVAPLAPGVRSGSRVP